MDADEIYRTTGLQPVNIVVGRFQPLTDGHMKCAQEVYNNTDIKTVLLMIDVAEHKTNALKPFKSDMLKYMYANILSTESLPYIMGIMSVGNADIVQNAAYLKENGYIPVSWSCGTDRVASYQKMCKSYAVQAGLPDAFQIIEIKRKSTDFSATQIRYAIASDDFETFYKNTPFKVLNRVMARRYFDQLMVEYAKVVNDFTF